MKRSQYTEAGILLTKLKQIEDAIKAWAETPTARPLLNIAKGAGTDLLASGIQLPNVPVLELLRAQAQNIWAELEKLGIEHDEA